MTFSSHTYLTIRINFFSKLGEFLYESKNREKFTVKGNTRREISNWKKKKRKEIPKRNSDA